MVNTNTSGVTTLEGTEVCFDGEWKKHGEFLFRDGRSGEVTAQGAYDRGLENGPWIQILENHVRGEGSFRAGERHGTWTYTFENGRVQEQGSYEDGRRVGRWLAHRVDGSLFRDAMYAGGELNGEVRVFEKDGRTLDAEASGRFVDGERVGPL